MKKYSRLLAALLVFIVVILVGGFLVYVLLLRPTITTPSDVKAYVAYAGTKIIKQGSAGSFRVSPGTYTIKLVTNSGSEQLQVTHVSLFQHKTLSLSGSLPAIKTSELVTSSGGLEPLLMDDGLHYLDTIRGAYQQSDASGTVTPIYPAAGDTKTLGQVQQIYPLGTEAQIVVTADSVPYVASAGRFKPLDMTGIDTTNLNQATVLVGSNAVNSDFVLSVNGSIYHYASADSSPVSIAKISKSFTRLVYGGGKFLAFDTTMPYATTDISTAYGKRYLVRPLLVQISNKSSSELDNPAVDASLSPDGKHLVVSERQQPTATAYTLSNTTQTVANTIPRPDAQNALWINATELVFSAHGALWSYNTDDSTVNALVENLHLPPSSISLQRGGGVSFSTFLTAGSTDAVYRLSDASNFSQADNQHLIRFLQKITAADQAYSTAYSNINRPSFYLQLTYPPGNGNPTEQNAVDSFRQKLAAAQLNPNDFAIHASYSVQ